MNLTTLTSFPARSDDAEKFSGKADRLDKLRRTRRSLSQRLRNTNKEAVEMKDERVRYGEALMFSDYVKAIYPLLKDVTLSPDISKKMCDGRVVALI
ncbi:hypothetical protein HID58_012605 [Brassica napus]|uniref:Uncharacterized protein n=1 Tax=Brassica napus TaxID=3708 RepID=A0ABQ8E1J3_BRANA|nr:hypothetical protein HID58_012605 [Brassica napus]